MAARIASLAQMAILFVFTALGSETVDKPLKVLNLEDYPRWNSINSTGISENGVWVTYAYVPNEGDGTLFVKNLDDGTVHEIARGTRAVLSKDSQWVAYVVELPEEEAKKLRKQKKPVTRKVEVLNLASGEKFTVDKASNFKFSNASRHIAIQKDADRPSRPQGSAGGGRPGGRPGGGSSQEERKGSDLILRDLAKGQTRNIGNVSAFEFNKPGDLLAYTVSAPEKMGNGLYLLDLDNSAQQPLDSAEALYSQLSWDKEGSALAVLRGKKGKKQTQRKNTLLAFRGLDAQEMERLEYDPAADSSFPVEMVLSENGELEWSRDLSRIFVGIRQQREQPEESDEPKPNVNVWHWKDERVQSVQRVRAAQDRRFTYRSVLHLPEMRFLRLTDEDMPTVTLSKDGRWAVGRHDKPYRHEISWGGSRADYFRIDTASGEKQLIVEALGRPIGISPDSAWYLYQKEGHLWSYHLQSSQTRNISRSAAVSFINHEDDHPYEKPTYGLTGWSKDGKSVLVNHKFDIWQLPLRDGQPVNLTQGMGDREQIRFRYVNLDPSEESPRGRRFFFRRGRGSTDPIDTSQPMLLSAYGEWTKKSGYFRLEPGSEPQPLIFEDRSIGRPAKAKRADRILFTMQTFVDFPDYYFSATDFAGPQRVTEANPQQSEYLWGRRILVDYQNSNSVKLQATLALPAGYEPGRRYPMLVYFYEKMSSRHHQYSMPRYDDRPHMSTYASDGYLVLMPDVVYEIGRPGDSAVDCVSSAVRKVIELGYADPDHIGLQGHSWGGYQSSFILTQSDLFAAVVTGAPVTNLVSFYNELYKRTGTVQHGITEVGQVRMGTTPWKDMALYHSQSPVHQAEKIQTPFLILHGTDDGAVDWHQGLEYYNTARRLGKEVILLSYPGEPHHLNKRENQKDFQIRMKQFFDHYLKEAPAPLWMREGVDFLDKKWAAPTQMR